MKTERGRSPKQATTNSNNLPIISVVSFLCAVFVVATHLYPVSGFTGSVGAADYVIMYLAHGVATVAVPTFFALSGFLFFRGVKSHRQVADKLKKRLSTLVLPYIAWNSLYFVYYIITAKMPFRSQEKVLDYSLSGILEAIFLHRYIYIMWFMLNLIILTYAFANLVFLLFRHKRIGRVVCLLTVLLGCLGIGSLSIPIGDSDVGLFTFTYGSYWFLGALIAIQDIKLPSLPKSVSAVSLALWPVCSVLVFLGKDDIAFVSLNDIFVLLNTVFFLIAIIGFGSYIPQPKYSMNMIIYGGHGLCNVLYLFAAQKLLAQFSGTVSEAAGLVCYLAGAGLVVAVCYFVGVLMRKWLPPLYKIFSGGR